MKAYTWEDDKKFYLEIPDPNFSPARNKAVVENTIRKHNAMRIKKRHEFNDAYAERADAVATYLRSFDKPVHRNLQQYFSPSYLAFLRGDEIRKKLMANMTFLDPHGKELVKKF